MLSSIEVLNKQCLDAWQAMKKIKLPNKYKKINKIVLFGMGGSLLGIDVIRHLFNDKLKKPVFIVNDYQMPAYLDKNTLAILSSYSGNTEETVAAAKNILSKTKKIFVITTGKFLAEFAKKNKLPIYLINPQHNPCNQPRMAVGYSIISQLSLFNKLGLIKINERQIFKLVTFLTTNKNRLKNIAKQQAKKIKNKIIIYIASEFLLGNAHIISNQTNENGKNFAAFFAIPELNHHLMEGIGNPVSNKSNLLFLFLNSPLYFIRNQKRYQITKKVINKNHIQWLEFVPQAQNKFLQSFEVLQWGSYLSFYLALSNKIDPSPIPWVDYFKHELR